MRCGISSQADGGHCERPSSRKALAAVSAADRASHFAHRSVMPALARWPALFAALTAASALRLEGFALRSNNLLSQAIPGLG